MGQRLSLSFPSLFLPLHPSPFLLPQVNCNDEDQGVLFGRWDNRYEDGMSPMAWIGSVDILKRWKNFGCQPVKYGQCWVFAAVACTGESRCLWSPLPHRTGSPTSPHLLPWPSPSIHSWCCIQREELQSACSDSSAISSLLF